ncbi:MAG: hypothetical protein AB7T59_06260 [Hyphomonadaceae bacterium]
MRQLVSVVFAAVLAAAAPALAQESAGGDDIVVTASRLDEMIREFVGEVTAETQAEGQIARWDHRICPQIAGLQRRQAQFIVDRLSQRAHQIGLRPGGPECRANILIFVTPDADRFTQELTAQFPVVFNPRVPNMHQQSNEALAQFVVSDAPVRWWHVSQTTSMEGQIVRNTDPRWDRTGGITGLSIVRTGITSRIQRPTHQDFNRVVIIVDATRAAGHRFDALADYLAMVALAQINPGADTTEADSILNLFADTRAESAVEALTTWDIAYLEGLYEARPNAWTARQQQADISRRMRTTELDAEYLDEAER